VRKIVGFKYQTSLEISFNERHPVFNCGKTDVFLTSHMDS